MIKDEMTNLPLSAVEGVYEEAQIAILSRYLIGAFVGIMS